MMTVATPNRRIRSSNPTHWRLTPNRARRFSRARHKIVQTRDSAACKLRSLCRHHWACRPTLAGSSGTGWARKFAAETIQGLQLVAAASGLRHDVSGVTPRGHSNIRAGCPSPQPWRQSLGAKRNTVSITLTPPPPIPFHLPLHPILSASASSLCFSVWKPVWYTDWQKTEDHGRSSLSVSSPSATQLFIPQKPVYFKIGFDPTYGLLVLLL